MKRLRIGLLVCVAVVSLPGCGLETGSGNVVSEARDLAGFDGIAVSDGIRVVMTVMPGASHSVEVRYDDNLIEKLTTKVDGTTLVIEFEGNVNVVGGGNRAVTVVLPELDSIDASGGASVKASGQVEAYGISASGGASIAAAQLQATDVDIDASGGASVRVFASSSVTGDASGGASIKVNGSPPTVRVDKSGGATVDS